MGNQKQKGKVNKLLILLLFIYAFFLKAQVKYNSEFISKNKCAVYYYPLEACLHCEHKTEDIVNMGCYGHKFNKINPRLFLQLDTLFKHERKIKSITKKWEPYTVLKIQYKDTAVYITVNGNETEYKRSDVILKDSVFTFDKSLLDLFEQNVNGFKQVRRNQYPKPRNGCKWRSNGLIMTKQEYRRSKKKKSVE